MKKFLSLVLVGGVFAVSSVGQVFCPTAVAKFSEVTEIVTPTLPANRTLVTPLTYILDGKYLAAGTMDWGNDPARIDEGGKRSHGAMIVGLAGDSRNPIMSAQLGGQVASILTFPGQWNWLGLGMGYGFSAVGPMDEAKPGFLYHAEPKAKLDIMGGLAATKHTISPDGKLAIVDYVTTATVYAVKTGKERFTLQFDLAPPYGTGFSTLASAFSHDSETILTVHQWGIVGVWNAKDGKLIHAVPVPKSVRHLHPGIQASPDTGIFVVSIDADSGTRADGEEAEEELAEGEDDPAAPKASDKWEGHLFRLMGKGEKLQTLSLGTLADVLKSRGGDAKNDAIVFYKFVSNHELVIGTDKGTVLVFDASGAGPIGEPKFVFTKSHLDTGIMAVAKSSQGVYATGDKNGIVTLWKPSGKGVAVRLDSNAFSVQHLNFSPDGTSLLVQVRRHDHVKTGTPFVLAAVSQAYTLSVEKILATK